MTAPPTPDPQATDDGADHRGPALPGGRARRPDDRSGSSSSSLVETLEFFREVSPIDFFTGTIWSASIKPYAWGVLAAGLRHPPGRGHRDDHRHPARPPGGGPPVRLRIAAGAHHGQADPRDDRRHPDHRARLLRHQLPRAAAPEPDPRPGEHRDVLCPGRRHRGRPARSRR